MSSSAPITEANCTNAQNSTGPRTQQGKDRSRLNGLRHGLTGQTVVMPHEDRKAFEHHVYGIMESLNPETDVEKDLARSIANDQWRLNRARAIEENIFALGQTTDPVLPEGVLEEAALLLQLAASEGRNYNPQQDGFAFSIPEVTRYIDRCHRLNQARELARQAAKPVQAPKSASGKAA